MQQTLLVECPFCHGKLEVERESGKVVGKWEAQKGGSGDKMKDAIERMKAEKAKRDKFFENAAQEMDRRKKEANDKFEQEKERLKKEGDVSRPPNPFDLD